MKPGDKVKFREVKDTGEEHSRFVVVELRGDRVLIESIDPFWDTYLLKPQQVVLCDELELVTA